MSHYEVLGVERGADAATLRRAYLRQARRHHPDAREGDSEAMLRVNEAWAVLGDPRLRARYDEALFDERAGARVTRLDHGGFVPHDRDTDDDEEVAAWRYSDDQGDPRTAPRRSLVFAPMVGLLVAVAAGAMWVVTGLDAALAVGAVGAALTLLGFLAAPLVALANASRYERHR